ncbi:Lipid particle protein [Pleurostoma richardsiae]|uniref:Lipid particle protein n=1 Tax=Pleurostoma richardsiae TaxID=41990 RepID=A0AA38SDY2_9PEZI|nr:Lipid particle protein [Pleurostoma richardsiae]
MSDYTGGSVEADHLCVLVHGLWGNPNHMMSIAKALRAMYPPEKLYILVAKRNSGSFTYDGVELGGERVCLEIEEELASIAARGGRITKLSVVGYSLGGLVARYAIGLLYAKGVLNRLECMSFTAFASPFLGVRTPLKGWSNHLWNVLGARTLSKSGRQLFGIDKFRDTGRPLLAVMADPDSIFVRGLARFRRRTLYANIVNDLSAVYYTTGISRTDPYTDLSKVRVNYVEGYEDVILDPANPVVPLPADRIARPTFTETFEKWVKRIPFLLALAIFVPVGVLAFLLNSVIQTVRSNTRIALHEGGKAGIRIEDFRPPLWMTGIREAVEDAYEELNSSQDQEYLHRSDDSGSETDGLMGADDEEGGREILALERKQSHREQPTLALAPHQFEMINGLDSLGWHKYPVWIHKDRHSHAAIIVRMEKESFSEGRLVLDHWLKREFLM